MTDLTHLFKIGENIKYVVNDFDEKKIYDGMLISREQKKCVQLESIYYLSIFRHPAWLTLI